MKASWTKRRTLTGHIYSPVAGEPFLAKESICEDSDEISDVGNAVRVEARLIVLTRRLAWMTTALLIFILTTAIVLVAYIMKKPSDRECGIQTSVWSPGNEAVEYQTVSFDNAFAHQTVYRGPPSPDLERAWEDLWLYEGVRIPADKLHLLNRTFDIGDEKTLKVVEDSQGGYHALIEVFHQLHCLNLIRQYTWRDWYTRHENIVKTPTSLSEGEVAARMHVDHCIETLRISLQCHGDMTPYMMMRDPTAPGGQRADFNSLHKCRNFDKLRNWAEENQLSPPPKMDWDPAK